MRQHKRMILLSSRFVSRPWLLRAKFLGCCGGADCAQSGQLNRPTTSKRALQPSARKRKTLLVATMCFEIVLTEGNTSNNPPPTTTTIQVLTAISKLELSASAFVPVGAVQIAVSYDIFLTLVLSSSSGPLWHIPAPNPPGLPTQPDRHATCLSPTS